jgi:hypothetical protein
MFVFIRFDGVENSLWLLLLDGGCPLIDERPSLGSLGCIMRPSVMRSLLRIFTEFGMWEVGV